MQNYITKLNYIYSKIELIGKFPHHHWTKQMSEHT